MERDDIALIFVLYEPTHKQMLNVEKFSAVYKGCVVDNSAEPCFKDDRLHKMKYMYNKGNKGIAYAQNEGITFLLQNSSCKYFVFLDQDTEVDVSYPMQISSLYVEASHRFENLAFLGPTIVNKSNGIEYKSIFHKKKKLDETFELRREVISSGSCITKDVLLKIGLSDTSLFIDFVDCEWCWRANALGYINLGAKNLYLNHRVGRKDYYIKGYQIMISAPFRYFYQYRNYLWLARRHYSPVQWRFAFLIKNMCRLIYFPFIIKDGVKCWKYMIKGLYAGLKRQPNGINI